MCTDEFGTTYSCHYTISRNAEQKVLFNGYNKTEIMNPRLKGLNLYARLCYARFKRHKDGIEGNVGKTMSTQAVDAFLDIIKCPV